MILLDDMLQRPTSDQIKRSIYSVLGAIGASTTVWKPGAVVRTIIAAVAIVLAGFSQLIYLVVTGGFLTLATGGWLTLLARYVFGVERNLASFATGSVQITNDSGAIYAFAAGDFIVKNLDTGKTYKNISLINVGANSAVAADFVAIEAGSASSSIIGGITGFGGATLPGVSIYNFSSLVGLDDELDPSLTVRCLDKLGSLSPNGPIDAYAFVARNAKRQDGNAIGVNRLSHAKDGYGNIDLTVAGPSGAILGTIGDPTTDLGALQLAILSQCTPLCVTPRARSAVPVVQNFVGTIYAYSTQGLTVAGVIDAANKALGEALARAPIGGYVIEGNNKLPKQVLEGAIEQAIASAFYVKFTTPANDVLPGLQQIVTLGATNFSVQFQQAATL